MNRLSLMTLWTIKEQRIKSSQSLLMGYTTLVSDVTSLGKGVMIFKMHWCLKHYHGSRTAWFMIQVLRIISVIWKEHWFVETHLSACEDINLEFCTSLFYNTFLKPFLHFLDFIHLINIPSIWLSGTTPNRHLLIKAKRASLRRWDFTHCVCTCMDGMMSKSPKSAPYLSRVRTEREREREREP